MNAWYERQRLEFLDASVDSVVSHLAAAAIEESLHVEPEQFDEWKASVGLLQAHLDDKAEMIQLLKKTLKAPDLSEYEHVVLEYDFRRRGLRLDCVLLGNGIIAIVEFKRSRVAAADRDQVTDYAINLVEFHEETRRLSAAGDVVVVPLLALTSGPCARRTRDSSFHEGHWNSILRHPIECDRNSLHVALRDALAVRRSSTRIDPARWLKADFSPSSTIIDAAISLYGQHDVSAIKGHAAEIAQIDRCCKEVGYWIERSLLERVSRVIFVSGAPGAGKTLVGLKLAFDPRFRQDAVFVTGNAPLVDVLAESLRRSYRPRQSSLVLSGYARQQARRVIEMSTFKIVKAHSFLGDRGKRIHSRDGRVVIFDEAQRTYEKGRIVLRNPLEDDEALLILKSLDETYGSGAVVVALVGHNQAINRGEMGIAAWLKAADQRGWRVAIGKETLELSELTDFEGQSQSMDAIDAGHLSHSLRFYRNHEIEQWADRVLTNRPGDALAIAGRIDASHTIWLTRDLQRAKAWVREKRVGDETAGIVASGQARRLAAVGLFVDLKPSIAHWMLAPSGDIRSSNMLETVQNQFQVQGLEMDYALVCWDADLRRGTDGWRSYRITGNKWQKDGFLHIAINGYRVLLTRARKGMIVFVPAGDDTGDDQTRLPDFYDGIASYLLSCGAKNLDAPLERSITGD
jgi:hypothetical protein